MGSIKKVIVVGAGPTGLILALNLARAGIPVDVLEAASEVDEALRAAFHSAPGVRELRRAGVLEDVRTVGFIQSRFDYRKLDGTLLASLDPDDLPAEYPDKRTCLPVGQLCVILRKHLAMHAIARVYYDHPVVKVSQDEDCAWADVETAMGRQQRFSADYVVGCDGGKSMVRRSLFGERVFPGYSWDKQIVTTNVYYPFEKFGWPDINLIIDPEYWYMCGLLPGNVWRVTYGEDSSLTPEECIAKQPEKWKKMLPGNPDPDQYKITHIAPYRVAQRCAPHMRVGRVMLCGDAGHICNPFAGIGLTTGLVDSGNLFTCLLGIHHSAVSSSDSILSKYDTIRREIYHRIVDPVSTGAFTKMWSPDPDALARDDPQIQAIRAAKGNAELAIKIQLGQNALQHDFTQYFERELPEGLRGMAVV